MRRKYVGLGICLGIAIGAALDRVGLGLALGIAFGAAFSAVLGPAKAGHSESARRDGTDSH